MRAPSQAIAEYRSAALDASSRRKRSRATKAEMQARFAAIIAIVAQFEPCVQRAIVRLRQNGDIPFGSISDATRWQRKPRSFDSITAALHDTVRTYRRAVWRDAPVHIEFWIEKEALAGSIYDVTAEFDVPLLVARGYSSITFLHAAAEAIVADGKPAHVYQLGDWDPSGQNAADHIERKLREYAPGCEIHYEKLAVTQWQIDNLDLPRRPTKKSDTRTKRWKGGDSVELDALPPDTLRQLVRHAIERHIDPRRLAVIGTAEQSEREIAKLFALLGSDKPGERDAAGLAAHRMVQQHDLSWTDLLAPPVRHREPLQSAWRATCRELQQRQYQHDLRPWERMYVAHRVLGGGQQP